MLQSIVRITMHTQHTIYLQKSTSCAVTTTSAYGFQNLTASSNLQKILKTFFFPFCNIAAQQQTYIVLPSETLKMDLRSPDLKQPF